MDDLVRPCLDLFCSCFCQELGNNTDLDENLNTLNREIEKLREKVEDVRARVDFAETQLRRTRRRDVKEWLEGAEKLEKEVAGIQEEREALEQPLPSWPQAPGRWLRRCRLSGRAADALRMVRFLRRYGQFSRVADD